MHGATMLAVLASVTLTAAACGDDGSTTGTTPAPATPATTTVAPTTSVSPSTSTPPTTVAPPTTAPATAQVALWPAAGVVLATPEEAARSFALGVLGFEPAFGPFAAGDSRSGEIEMFAREGSNVIGSARSTLLLRQLPPDDGWFVIGAVSGGVSIDRPTSAATVPVGQVRVDGAGTGFEALVLVDAFIAGSPTLLDRQTTMAGNFGEILPFDVTVDLGATSPGDIVVLVARGGVGLETDPGDLAALAIVMD